MSNLQDALNTLSASERKTFSLWLRSPVFNKRAVLAQLGDYLLECAGVGKTPDIEKEKTLIDPDSAMAPEQSLRLHKSALMRQLEQFLIWKEQESDPVQGHIALATAFRKRGLAKHFMAAQRHAAENLRQTATRNAEFLEYQYRLEWELYQWEASRQRSVDLNLQSCSDVLDQAFIAAKLRLACLALSHQAVYKTEYQLQLLPYLVGYIQQTPALERHTAIGLYYRCYLFLSEPDGEQHFRVFQERLSAVTGIFPVEELRILYLLAINYGIKKINQSAEGAVTATFELYKNALQSDLLLENGQISRFAFSNIVAIGLRAGQNAWVENFILHYKPKLDRQWRESIASLSTARLEYQRKNYNAALWALQRADYKDTMNNLTAKILQMKIYFETDAYDALEHHLKNLKNYIRRHTAIGYHRTNYLNILRYTEALMHLAPMDKTAIFALQSALEQEKILTEKDWLLEKTNTLLNGG